MSAFHRFGAAVRIARSGSFPPVRRWLLAAAVSLTVLITILGIGAVYRDLVDRLTPPSHTLTQPELSVEQTVRDYGVRRRGEVLSVAFSVRNTGARRLILQRQVSDCGCLSGEPEVMIAAGQRRPIHLTLDTGQFQGPILVPIRYQTNDPSRPLVEFEVRADVRVP